MKKLFYAFFTTLLMTNVQAKTLNIPAFNGTFFNPTQAPASQMTVAIEYYCYYRKLGVMGESSPVEWTTKSCGQKKNVATLTALDTSGKRFKMEFPAVVLRPTVSSLRQVSFQASLSIKYGPYLISDQVFGATSINTDKELASFIKKNQDFAYIKMNEAKVNFVLADGNSAIHEIRQRFSPKDALKVETTIDPENVSKVNLSGAYVPLFGRRGFFNYGLESFSLYPTGVLILGVTESSEIKFRQRVSKWDIGYEGDKYYSTQEASIKLNEFDGNYPSSFVNIVVDDNWHP